MNYDIEIQKKLVETVHSFLQRKEQVSVKLGISEKRLVFVRQVSSNYQGGKFGLSDYFLTQGKSKTPPQTGSENAAFQELYMPIFCPIKCNRQYSRAELFEATLPILFCQRCHYFGNVTYFT